MNFFLLLALLCKLRVNDFLTFITKHKIETIAALPRRLHLRYTPLEYLWSYAILLRSMLYLVCRAGGLFFVAIFYWGGGGGAQSATRERKGRGRRRSTRRMASRIASYRTALRYALPANKCKNKLLVLEVKLHNYLTVWQFKTIKSRIWIYHKLDRDAIYYYSE